MKRIVLTSSAVAALTLGSALAVAQQGNQGNGIQASPAGTQGQTRNPATAAAGEATQSGMSADQQGSATQEDLLRRNRKPGGAGAKGANASGGQDTANGGANGSTQQTTRTPSADANSTAATDDQMQGGNQTRRKAVVHQGTQTPASGTGNSTTAGRETGNNAATGQGVTVGVQTNSNTETAAGHGQAKIEPQRAQQLRSRLVGLGGTQANVNFNLQVGVAVPQTIRVRPLPPEIIVEFPQFRGYDFVVVRDEVVIIEPRTRHVVQVLGGAGGQRTARGGATGSMRLRLTPEQRSVLRRDIHDRSGIAFSAGTGALAPSGVSLIPIPQIVVADVPDIRGFEYFVTRDGHIVIVNPESREVVDVID